MSHEFSIHALQDLIAEPFGLCLPKGKDVTSRAGELWTALSVIQNHVIILDDFHPEKVGISRRTNGCKLILTTRSLDICNRMDCQRIIKVEPLSEGEAWNLFIDKLGHGVALSPTTKQIAESMVKKCSGLALGILTMTRSMKGVDDVSQWRNALRELASSEIGTRDMETDMFRILKFSFVQLKNKAMKECLYCALFPKDMKT
jgi:disease resistance protein RPS2